MATTPSKEAVYAGDMTSPPASHPSRRAAGAAGALLLAWLALGCAGPDSPWDGGEQDQQPWQADAQGDLAHLGSLPQAIGMSSVPLAAGDGSGGIGCEAR